METLFVKLYPLVALLSLSGYVPQILKLIRARTPNDGISLQSWLTWIFNCCISLGYGIFHLRDLQFIITMATSMCSMLAVVGMVIYNRRFRRFPPPPKSAKSPVSVCELRAAGLV